MHGCEDSIISLHPLSDPGWSENLILFNFKINQLYTNMTFQKNYTESLYNSLRNILENIWALFKQQPNELQQQERIIIGIFIHFLGLYMCTEICKNHYITYKLLRNCKLLLRNA